MKRKIIYITIAALLIVVIGLTFYAFRTPYVSDTLKKVILPELELLTGKEFTARNIYINIFPLFIGFTDVKAFDEDGSKVFSVEKVKGYVEPLGLIRNEIIFKRLSLSEPEINLSREQVEDVIENIKKYMAGEFKIPYTVIVRSVNVSNADISFEKNNDWADRVLARDMDASIILFHIPRFRISSEEITFVKDGLPEIKGRLNTHFLLREKHVELRRLDILSGDFEIKTSGIFEIEKLAGELQAEINVNVKPIHKFFALQNSADGRLSANGHIRIDGLESPSDIFVDMGITGSMYLETLAEFLKVKETLEGYIDFKGNVTGRLNDLRGEGRASLKEGNLFGVEIDKLVSDVSYKGGAMRFSNGNAYLYGGTASVQATIKLLAANYYSFKVKARDIESKEIFKLIGWDPNISEGKITGEVASSGGDLNLYGNFIYKSKFASEDVTFNVRDRIKGIEGEFNMKNDVVHFANLSIFSDKSNITVSGKVDLANNSLNFAGDGATKDIKDFTYPYFTALSGPVSFSTTISGKFDDPMVGMQFSSRDITLSTENLGAPDILKDRDMNFHKIKGEITYRKNLLTIESFSAISLEEKYSVTGNINFQEALALFDLSDPDYNLDISAKNIDIRGLSETFYEAPPIAGKLNAAFRLYGNQKDIRASGEFSALEVRKQNQDPRTQNQQHKIQSWVLDSVSGRVSYKKEEFLFSDLSIKRGNSTLNANGRLSLDKGFSFSASAEQLKLIDLIPKRSEIIETFLLTDIEIRGEGTFEEPHIEVDGDIYGGVYRGVYIGKGKISGTLRGKHFELIADLLNDRLHIRGNATVTETLPWSARVELRPARYDFIVAGLLKDIKDIPEDLLLSLAGVITADGDRNNINAVATINSAHIGLYGADFKNSSDIKLTLSGRRLFVEAMTMRSDFAEFNLSGSVLIGESYDLSFEGSSSLAPLKATSEAISVISGDSSFNLAVSGDWNKPVVDGEINISNGTLGFRDAIHRLTSVSAYIYVDKNRVVLERVDGRFLGGDVNISGIVYLHDDLGIKRFFLQSRLNGLTTSALRNFWVNFDGNLYYRGDMESQIILGDIVINQAKYSENIEWRSLLADVASNAMPNKIPGAGVNRLKKTDLNVNISGDNIVIDNNIARASMKMDILLQGTVGQPIPLGKVETKEGVVYFRGNEFNILRARLDFSDRHQINPYFDIAAETAMRNYNIRLNLVGYAEQFNLSFSSSPHLNETDIFALLTVGQLARHVEGSEGGIGAGKAASFLTGKLQGVLQDRLKTVTGLDRIKVVPYASKATGTVTPRVTVGKRLLQDRLLVTYNGSVGTDEEQAWRLEYILGDNISLVGLRDERGGVGGDIKFRFEFK